MAVEMLTLPCWVICWNAMQSNFLPNFTIYKDSKEGYAYTVPQGSEIDVYCKVIPCQYTDGEQGNSIARSCCSRHDLYASKT